MNTPVNPHLNQEPPSSEDQTNDLDLKGRFARYNSPFLQLMIPVLTTRYLWLAAEDINPKNFLLKPDPASKPGYTPWQKPGKLEYLSRNFAALGMGATILSLIAYYSKSTADDIKTLYSEAVGYELGKKKEDVSWHDVFIKSNNEALKVTRNAFFRRTGLRALAGSAFLMPWHALRDWKNGPPKYDANANAGVGAVGLYLSLFEGFVRKQSFFDAEQNLVGVSINHSDTNTHEIIHSRSIQSLMLLQRKHMDKNYQWPRLNSDEGIQQAALANRIADLMNQTYHNTCRKEEGNFTIGKFNFLLGFGLLDSYPEAVGYVELANKSGTMNEVKEAAAAIHRGEKAQEVFQRYGVDLARAAQANTEIPDPQPLPHEHCAKFTDRVPAPQIVEPFAARVQKSPVQLPQAPRSPQEFAELLTTSPHLS